MYKLSAQSHRCPFRIKLLVGVRDGLLMFTVMYLTIYSLSTQDPGWEEKEQECVSQRVSLEQV